MKRHNNIVMMVVLILLIAFINSGCKNNRSNNAAPAKVPLSGSVSAPGGSIAFHQPSGIKAFFARLFAADAIAASAGMSSVGSGVTVNLIKIDDSGIQVGDVIATTTTDASGNYLLEAPAGFIPASNYVIQAVGSITTLQSIVSGTVVNVDPYTHTTALLVTGSIAASAGATITQVSAADVAAVLQTMVDISANVPVASLTLSQLVTALQTEVQNSEDASAIIASIASPVGITGTVVDSNNAPVANIEIRVRTFTESVIQAITRTDAAGNFTVRVPAGEYELLAVNDTTTSTAASAWWTSSDGATSQFSAEKITVTDTMLTKDFTLAPGGRISGTVTAEADGSVLNGINIVLREYMTGVAMMGVTTRGNGNYSLNIAPGSYFIAARNSTVQPYATEVFNGTDDGTNRLQAQRLVIAANDNYTADMSLLAGSKIEGAVIDPLNGGAGVAGINVRFYNISSVEVVRTAFDGSYRIWLRPDAGPYFARARGQYIKNIDILSAGTSTIITFNAPVEKITAKIVDANGNPVGQAYAEVYNGPGTASPGSMAGFELSKGDGSVEVYSSLATTAGVLFKITSEQPIGSSVYLNKSRFYDATFFQAPISLGTITLPAGGVLKGVVTKDSGSGPVPVAGATVQVRSGGTDYSIAGLTSWGVNRFVTVNTMSDGSYTVSLPLGVTFARICAIDLGLSATTCTGTPASLNGQWTAVDNVTLNAPTTTMDFAF